MPRPKDTSSGPRPATEMLILAGGFGTRLRSVVADLPKPMAPVRGRPFLEYLLDYWIGNGVSRFALSTGYLGELIAKHFGDSYRSARIEYIREDSPLGTGGAIRMGLTVIAWRERHVLIANGDTWFEVDLPALRSVRPEAPVAIAAKRLAFNDRYGGMTLDSEGYVTAFGVGPPDNTVINAGCYLVDREILGPELQNYPPVFSFEQQTLVDLARRRLIAASVQTGEFLDIGIPADFAKAGKMIAQSSVPTDKIGRAHV